MSVKSFVSRNVVMIVMLPVIFGGHYGWMKLQEMDTLVAPEERERFQLAKYMKELISLERAKAAIGVKSE